MSIRINIYLLYWYFLQNQCLSLKTCCTQHTQISNWPSCPCVMMTLIVLHISMKSRPHRWRNGQRARLECGRSWVRATVGSNQRHKIGICCFSAKHAALRRKSKDWLARNQDNVTVVSVSQHYNNPTKCVGLVQSGPHHHLIENKLVLAMI